MHLELNEQLIDLKHNIEVHFNNQILLYGVAKVVLQKCSRIIFIDPSKLVFSYCVYL